ncbi:TonB-dependent siderophore receptor [Silvibacterium sp.]|uniref:TonB-dependent siderophore receptor n=1 Tax=Silvibacterium sp. TaxID=1964179 RepID=UPI0039E673E6
MHVFAGLLLFLSLAESPAPAPQHAVLQGVVTDTSGAAIPNADVSLETPKGLVIASTHSDAAGHYRLEIDGELEAGYRERVSAPGFHTTVEENLSLPDGATRNNDVHLTVGSTSQTVNVTASETTGNGEIATVAQAGILGTISESDLPFSASSYTSQAVLDQQAQTASDILANEVGIQEGNGRYSEDQYMSLRGFALNPGEALLNGMPGLVDSRSPNIENIERIEIFKGPTSFLNGASAYGAPGGTVNFVTKRAGDVPYYRADGGFSSSSEAEGHVDLGRRFLPQNALGVRFTMGGRMGDTPVDNQEENVAAAGLGVDYRGQKFHGSVDVSDQVRSMLAARDVIYVDPGFAIPKAPNVKTNIFDHSSSYVGREQLVLAQGDYELTPSLDVYGTYGFGHELETAVGPGYAWLTDAQGDVGLEDLPYLYDYHNYVARAGVRDNVQTGPIHNDITLAGDYLQFMSGFFYEYDAVYSSNMYHPIAIAPLEDPLIGDIKSVPDTNLNRNSSVALADVATAFHGKLVVIGGVRGQWIGTKEYGTVSRGNNNSADFTACTSQCSYNQGIASPSVAAMYHLPKGFSIYGNYIQDLQAVTPTAGATNQNEVFAPAKTNQKEAGVKYEHGTLQATLALYQIAEPDGVENPTTLVFAVTGEQRNRGLEFTLGGNIAPGLRVNGGVSFLDARQINTGDSTTDGKRAEGVPATESTVNFEWTVPYMKKALNLDARVTDSSSQWVDTAETQSIPSWARLDVGGRYDLKWKWDETIRVNIDNVTGANYYESGLLGLAFTGPRTVRVSAGVHF